MVSFFAYGGLAVVDRETIASLVAVIGLTSTKYPPTNTRTIMAVVQAVGGSARFTVDGTTNPVAGTTGHILATNGVMELWGDSMKKFLAINDTGQTAKLEVSYFGRGS